MMRKEFFNKLINALPIVLCILMGCKKLESTNQPASRIAVFNGLTGRSINFRLSDQKTNADSISFGGNLAYADVIPNNYKLEFTDAKNSATILTQYSGFLTGKSYSFFLTRKSEVYTDSITLLVTNDELIDPLPGKAKIRFVNLIAGAPKLDVFIIGRSKVTLPSQAFSVPSSFSTIDSVGTYNIEIVEAGKKEIKYKISNYAIQSNQIYTIWTYGFWSGTGLTALGAKVYHNTKP